MGLLENIRENNVIEFKKELTDVNFLDEKKRSLLFYAIYYSSIDITKILLENGAKVNLVDKYYETPLFECARRSKINYATLLLENGANVNLKNTRGETPIHLAAQNGNIDFVKLLVEYGAKLDSKTKEDLYPIHYSIMAGNLEVFKYLFDLYQIGYQVRDPQKNTFLHFAAKTSNFELVSYLIEKGIDPNSLNSYFETPLFNAVKYGTREVALLLLQKGTFIEIQSSRFETVIEVAQFFKNKDMYDLLIEFKQSPRYQKYISENQLSLYVLNREFSKFQENITNFDKDSQTYTGKTVIDYIKDNKFNSLLIRLNL
jgi:ankyrin repeat protein